MRNRSKSPIFIGGFYKSGTSLLRAMLGKHSAIASGLESYWFDLDWFGPRDQKFAHHIERLCNFYEMDEPSMQLIIDKSDSSLHFLDNFMNLYAERTCKRRWAEKTPGNILHLDEIFSKFPDAMVIHIIRDPKDVFASLRQAKKWDSVPVFSKMWSEMLGAADRFQHNASNSNSSVLSVRYESLVLEPTKTISALLDFIGEEWEEGIDSFSGQKGEFEKVLSLTGKASTTLDRLSKPLSKKRIGIWKKTVELAEIELVRKEVDRHGLLPLFLDIETNT